MDLPRTPSFRLDGRRALVTGASSAIGLASACALAEAGAEVTLAARRRERLEEVAAAIADAGWRADVLPLDAGDLDAALPAIRQAGPFDMAVNCAGAARPKSMADMTPEDYDFVADLNLKSAYFIAREVAEGMKAAGRPGAIVQMSSQMGHVGGIDRTVYCATKFGIEGVTKAMALEYAPFGIRVNTVAPTFIRTPLTEPTFANPDRVRWIEEKIKLGRVGEVEDIMGAVLFLCSDAAALVTGTSLIVDGGWTAD